MVDTQDIIISQYKILNTYLLINYYYYYYYYHYYY